MAAVFTDTFLVTAVNPEKKIFDRVDRLQAKGETYECELIIDVNCDLWRIKKDDVICVTLANALVAGQTDDGLYRQSDEASLLDTVRNYSLQALLYSSL